MYIKMTAESFPVNGVKCIHFDGVTEMTENQTTADKFEAEQRGWEEGGQIISQWVHFVMNRLTSSIVCVCFTPLLCHVALACR